MIFDFEINTFKINLLIKKNYRFIKKLYNCVNKKKVCLKKLRYGLST